MRGMYFFRWYLVEFCVIFSIFVYFFSIFLNGSHVTNKAAKLLLDREAVQVLQEPLKAAKVLEKVVICNILRFSLKNLTIHILCFDFCQQSTFLSSSDVLWLQIQCRNKVSIFYQQARTARRSEYGMTVYLCIWSILIPRYVRLLLTRSGWLRLWLIRVILAVEFSAWNYNY